MSDNKTAQKPEETEGERLSEDDLDQVVGGHGIQDVAKKNPTGPIGGGTPITPTTPTKWGSNR